MSDLEQARLDDPDGCKCGLCGNDNDFADDCGWFYVDSLPLCSYCYDSSGFMTSER